MEINEDRPMILEVFRTKHPAEQSSSSLLFMFLVRARVILIVALVLASVPFIVYALSRIPAWLAIVMIGTPVFFLLMNVWEKIDKDTEPRETPAEAKRRETYRELRQLHLDLAERIFEVRRENSKLAMELEETRALVDILRSASETRRIETLELELEETRALVDIKAEALDREIFEMREEFSVLRSASETRRIETLELELSVLKHQRFAHTEVLAEVLRLLRPTWARGTVLGVDDSGRLESIYRSLRSSNPNFDATLDESPPTAGPKKD